MDRRDTSAQAAYHRPVMSREIVQYLVEDAVRVKVVLDLTLGDGGHTEALLRECAVVRVIGVDRDGEALARATDRLREFRDRLTLVQANFADVSSVVRGQNLAGVDGIVADLGVSSRHLDCAARGFSFQRAGPLDMRMDPRDATTAADIVNTWSESQLVECFRTFGEERFATSIARAIGARRGTQPFVHTIDLAAVIYGAVPGRARHGRIHPATRVFQALRIAVNRELDSLQQLLADAPLTLNPAGRLAVMSYHSLEDRLVKHTFRALAKSGTFRLLTKRPQVAADDEVHGNPRARSAKLRVIERSGA